MRFELRIFDWRCYSVGFLVQYLIRSTINKLIIRESIKIIMFKNMTKQYDFIVGSLY